MFLNLKGYKWRKSKYFLLICLLECMSLFDMICIFVSLTTFENKSIFPTEKLPIVLKWSILKTNEIRFWLTGNIRTGPNGGFELFQDFLSICQNTINHNNINSLKISIFLFYFCFIKKRKWASRRLLWHLLGFLSICFVFKGA